MNISLQAQTSFFDSLVSRNTITNIATDAENRHFGWSRVNSERRSAKNLGGKPSCQRGKIPDQSEANNL